MAAFFTFGLKRQENESQRQTLIPFFPSEWDINKIKKVLQEASENITFKQGNKYRGITSKELR